MGKHHIISTKSNESAGEGSQGNQGPADYSVTKKAKKDITRAKNKDQAKEGRKNSARK